MTAIVLTAFLVLVAWAFWSDYSAMQSRIVLLTLGAAKSPLAGLELVKAAKVSRGVIYVVLGRLEQQGLVKSAELERQEPFLIPQRVYWLSREGRALVDDLVEFEERTGR